MRKTYLAPHSLDARIEAALAHGDRETADRLIERAEGKRERRFDSQTLALALALIALLAVLRLAGVM